MKTRIGFFLLGLLAIIGMSNTASPAVDNDVGYCYYSATSDHLVPSMDHQVLVLQVESYSMNNLIAELPEVPIMPEMKNGDYIEYSVRYLNTIKLQKFDRCLFDCPKS